MDIKYTPKYERSAELVGHLAGASALLETIKSLNRGDIWVPRARRDALARHAHYSSRIEGNPLTLPEVEALVEGKEIRAEGNARREILNFLAAMRWIWKKGIRKGVAEKSLLEVHGILTKGLIPQSESGHYKTVQNAVYKGRAVIYRPPPPEAAPFLTRALLAWINSREAAKEHPVVVAGVAHHRLVSIHPVLDGNGRLARLLEAWILYERDFDTDHIFALPEFYEADRDRYYREIQQVRDHGDELTSWLEFVGEGVVETLDKTKRRVDSREYSGKATPIRLNKSQKAILNMLAAGKPVSGPELCGHLGISRSLLSRWLKPMLQAKLVVKEGSTKAAIYRLPAGKGTGSSR